MSDFRFKPVRGTESQIARIPYTEGAVYFTTDTNKIYLDAYGERAAMGGNSGIYYGKFEPPKKEEGTTDDTVEFEFTKDDIEGDELPNPNDLILNIPDGCFYRVLSLSQNKLIIYVKRLTVAGGGGGYVQPLSKKIGIKLGSLETDTLINGQDCSITFTANAGKDTDGSVMDDTIYIHWYLTNTTGGGSQRYYSGTSLKMKVDEEGNCSGVINFGMYLAEDATSVLTVYAQGNNSGKSLEKEVEVKTRELLLYTSFSVKNTFSPTNILLTCNAKGDMDKFIKFSFDGEVIKYERLGATAPNLQDCQVPSHLATHGPHTCTIELMQALPDGQGGFKEGLATEPLEFEIAVVEPGNNTPIIWLDSYKKTYYNYDNIQIYYLVYDPTNTAEATVYLKKNNIEIASSPRTFDNDPLEWQLFEITDAEMGVINNYSLECQKGDTPRRISFNVVKDPNRDMEYVKPKQMVLNFDAKGRSNAESVTNREIWESEDGSIKASFKNFNWYNNGWVLDEQNQTCLRISNGAEFSLPIGTTTFASNSASAQSHTFEMQFKIRNVQDYGNLIKNITRYKYKVSETETRSDDDWYKAFGSQTEYNNYDAFLQAYLPIWSQTSDIKVAYDDLLFDRVQKNISLDKAVCKYLSGDANNATGLCLGPQDAFFSNGTNTVNVNYVENDMVYLTAVYDHSSNNNLMYIYINGVITGVISSTRNGSWTIDSGNMVFNSDFCDIDLYKIRIYNGALSVNDVVTNHSVDKKDVLIYDQNRLAEENTKIHEYQFKYQNMIKYNEEHPSAPLMPYIVFDTSVSNSNDRLSWAKKEKMTCRVEFVNTGLDAAYARGQLEGFAIQDGLCKDGDSAAKKAEAIKTYYKHHCPSFIGEYCELAVQGTSSEFYPRRNYKIKTKTNFHKDATGVEDKLYHILLHKGPFAEDYAKDMSDLSEDTIKYGEESTRQEGWYMDNYTNSTDRWTMKVDYMESSGSYNAGFASMAATAYSKHPLEDYVEKEAFYDVANPSKGKEAVKELLKSDVTKTLRWQDYRTSLRGFPVLAFHKKSNGEYLYIGMYRMLLDKGSDDVLGFELPENITGKFVGDKEMTKKAECWEFANNSRGFCSYRDPWKRVELSFKAPDGTPEGQAYTSAGAPIIADSIEYRYNDKADAIDAVLNLKSMTDKEKKNFLKETKLTAFDNNNPEDLEFARNWLLDVYKNWEKVNKWVWSTNIDNVVGEGTYELTEMYAAEYKPGTYYREIKNESTDVTTGVTTVTVTYELEDSSSMFNDGKSPSEWWSDIDSRVTYYNKNDILNDAGEITSTTYVPVKVISKEALAAQPIDAAVKAYIYELETYYTEIDGAYSLSKESFNDSEDYYVLHIGNYQDSADLLVKPADGYVEDTDYYYYDGSVEIKIVGDKNSLAVSEATDIVDAESYAAAVAAGRVPYVASPVTYGRKTYTHDTKEYRAAKFVNELTQHFDAEYLATYFILTEVFECYDSRGKNCMMASWGPLEDGGDYIWYPIFYDIDTQLGINNTGIPSFEYNVDATEAGNYSTSDSLLWNNFYKYFKNSHILNKYKHLRGVTDNVDWDKLSQPTLKDINDIEKWYKFDESVYGSLACRGVRPLIATNLDMWWKYITITNEEGKDDGSTGWLDREGSYTVDLGGTYFYALQGDRSQSRRQFLTSRIEYIDSWLNQGNYQRGGSNNIRGRVAANNPANTSDLWTQTQVPYYDNDGKKNRQFDAEYWINLKPIRSSYVTVSDDAEAYPSQKYDGVNPVKFEITAIKDGVMNSAGYPEQLLYIYGMNQMADLGEMHNLYWQEFDLTGDASHLTTLKLGTDELMPAPDNDLTINNARPALDPITIDGKQYYKWYNHRMNQPSIPAKKTKTGKGMPLLKEVNLSNIRVSTGSPVLDFSSCEKLQDFRATGSNFVQFTFAEGVALHTLYLPNTLTTLELIEANLLDTVLTEYSYPTRDEYGKLKAVKGLWIDGLFDNNSTSLNSVNLKGGALGYDSYKLLKQIYTIKEARPEDEKTTTTIQMTNVNWSPYIQLSEGDIYIKADENLYYKDNGHMRLVKYTYDKETFDRDVLNGEIYKYNSDLATKANQITNVDMLETMADDTFWKGVSDGSTVPNITGIIYVNNTDAIDEYDFRTSLALKYPNLTFFFAKVDEAYTAKFVIQEADGTYTYAVTDKGLKGLETIKEGWFTNPYNTYIADKDNYDFHGWSTSANPEDTNKLIGSMENTTEQNNKAWADAKATIFKEDQKTYVFYAIFTKTKHAITFMNGNEVHDTVYVTFGEPLVEPKSIPYKNDSDLDLTETYAFKGYTASPTSTKVVDISTYQADRPYEFYAYFEETSVYNNVTDSKFFTFTPTEFTAEDGQVKKGVAIGLNDKYELAGKITLPNKSPNGDPVVAVNNYGFNSTYFPSTITHIFWDNKTTCQVARYGDSSFQALGTLRYIEFPDSLVEIRQSCFNACGFNTSIHTGKNTLLIEDGAFNGAWQTGQSIEHFTVGSKVKTLGQRAIANLPSGTVINYLRIGEDGKASELLNVATECFRLNQNRGWFNTIEFYYDTDARKSFFEDLTVNGCFNLANFPGSITYVQA